MVSFFTEDCTFDFSGRKRRVSRWFKAVAQEECRILGPINVIFCSDPYLLELNRRFLGHDYYTDILTFDYSEGERLSGDLFLSIDTVRANALDFGSGIEMELHRVLVHGLLHLIGYDDHTPEECKTMRMKEDYFLSKLALAE